MSRRKPAKPALLLPSGRAVGEKVVVRPVLGPDSKPLLPSTSVQYAKPGIYDGIMGDSITALWKSMLTTGRSARYMGIDLGASRPSFYLHPKAVEGAFISEPKTRADDWRARFREQVSAIEGLDEFESGVKELPKADPDLTSYADAFAEARARCQHSNYEDTMYAKREARCNDCGQYFIKGRGLFGW